MMGHLPAGPYYQFSLDGDAKASFFIIPFDKDGLCVGPETRKALLDDARTGAYTDVYFFSHGWNNDWKIATGRYNDFINGFINLRKELSLPMPPKYKPLLIGIFWPSTALVTEDEAPQFAAGDPQEKDQATAETLRMVEDLASEMNPEHREQFYLLIQKSELDRDESFELAKIVTPLWNNNGDELPDAKPLTGSDLLKIWPTPEQELDLDGIRPAPGVATDAQVAGGDFFKKLLPRDLLRLFTVRQMKDRAGIVGANGVGPLLTELLALGTRVHLAGHSYGARVVLSAICRPMNLSGQVSSVLLLQPAISHLCFAAAVAGTGKPGGYRSALDRVKAPILSTFSSRDFPLTRVFHWALRRDRDLDEAQIAAGEPPSPYAALGGFGPRGCGEQLLDILDPAHSYPLTSGARVIGINGTRTIASHGDVSNRSTWWALHNLVASHWK